MSISFSPSPVTLKSRTAQGNLSFNSSFPLDNRFSSTLKKKIKIKNGCASSGFRCELKDDGFYMRRAVELARKGLGHTSPNPMVGCVIVRDGEIVGEGFHPKAGQPHAEVFALRDAGPSAENATAYVSLEPCNHYGRTPPCSEALINAKVKRVVVGMVDPNPIVASKGVDRLRQSGIDVLVGVEEMLCRKLNEAYIHRMLTGKPFITLRYTLSTNGRVLNYLGDGAEASGGYYSRFLQEYDGVVVSGSSFFKPINFPKSNEIGSNQPLLIAINRNLDASLDLSTLANSNSAQMVIFTEQTSIDSKVEGVEVIVLEKLNISSILASCAKRGLCSMLVDYRRDDGLLAELLEDGLKESLVQKVVIEVCPVWTGSDNSSVLKFGSQTLKLRDLFSRNSKGSVLLEGYIS